MAWREESARSEPVLEEDGSPILDETGEIISTDPTFGGPEDWSETALTE